MSRDHMEDLLDGGIKHAIHLLEKNGEFFPFGIVRSPDGEIALVYPRMHEQRPSPDRVIEKIVRGFAAGVRNGDYTATAVVSDVRLRDRVSDQVGDAIRVDLEDSESEAVTCYLPYTRDRDRVTTDQMRAEPGRAAVFR